MVFVSTPDGLIVAAQKKKFTLHVRDIKLIVQAGENIVFASDYNVYIVPFKNIYSEKVTDIEQVSLFKAKYRHRIVGINYCKEKIIIMHQ